MPSSDSRSFAFRVRQLRTRRILLLAGLLLLTCGSFAADLLTGPSSLDAGTALAGLFEPEGLSISERIILFDIRLPVALMAIVVGGSLGIAGAETQTALNNPLASPYTLGISWAAILGATLAIVFDLELPGIGLAVTLPLLAFIFAALAGLLILALAHTFGSNTETIILFGIALLFSCSALISLLQFVADAEDVQESVLWSIGSLTRATWESVGAVTVSLAVVFGFAIRGVWQMTVLRGGEEHARSIGLSIHRLRLGALMRAALASAMAVAFVGAIGFVGLVAPHITRMLLGEDHRFYLPGAVIVGAALLSLASICSKLIVSGIVIPVGIVTALVGIPVFVTLIVLQRRGK
ncbi:iron ABC transporter permease [Nisaea acidiphila]|uniref:Iron ABC transporter permease n=1 Tax=Nisaea acidiphila TaxID=1862145 RepID=A0A9J7APD6_9PROT|nr:iron ABC transporter permease [Nisaea acidiphila]UUX49022.1 iron ABC transporter permease [Nisaea acidiphila]